MQQQASDTRTGVAAGDGLAVGQAFLLERRASAVLHRHVDPSALDDELARLDAGIALAAQQLRTLKDKLEADGGTLGLGILDAQLEMMRDPLLRSGAVMRMQEELLCAEWAVEQTIEEISARFAALGDAVFRDRGSDVAFVGEKIIAALRGEDDARVQLVPRDAIVVAHALSPAEVLTLARRPILGFVTETGGSTSHTAILARTLGLPAVVACTGVLGQTGQGDTVIVDGAVGEVVLRPGPRALSRARVRASKRAAFAAQLEAQNAAPAVTRDGYQVRLLANIELDDEVPAARAAGAEGVGLYRSEYLFLNRTRAPSEAEHAEAARRILDRLEPGMPANLRTFDLGGDKMGQVADLPAEDNPALGLRAVRLALARPELARPQLRGLLQATAGGRGSLLLPMIGDVDTLDAMLDLIRDEMNMLEAEGKPVARDVPIGLMVELPAAVWGLRHLAERVQYLSVGTNDLVQYTAGVDRGNPEVAAYYQPLSHALLVALSHVSKTARALGKPVSVCGEVAGDPLWTPLLVALGFEALSMPPAALARVKWCVRHIDKSAADALLAACLQEPSTRALHRLVQRFMRERVPELFAVDAGA